jgi:hypothetical protein
MIGEMKYSSLLPHTKVVWGPSLLSLSLKGVEMITHCKRLYQESKFEFMRKSRGFGLSIAERFRIFSAFSSGTVEFLRAHPNIEVRRFLDGDRFFVQSLKNKRRFYLGSEEDVTKNLKGK